MEPTGPSDGVVILRSWHVDEVAFYLECIADEEAQRFTSDPPDLTPGDVAEALRALPGRPHQRAYLVADATTGERLGNVAAVRTGDTVELSYVVVAAARGRGVATRAVRLAAAAAFDDDAVRQVRLWTHEANVASRRVAERSGFEREESADRLRTVKGRTWPTVGFVCRREIS